VVEEDEGEDLVDEQNGLLGKKITNNVLNNFEGFQERKKRKQLRPARMNQIPKFEINEIIGNFDIDEEGNYIIISNGKDIRGKPRLEDMDGHRVNKRGYLINDHGQVVTRDKTIIFRADEVDEDDEVPAPFCYYKNKDSLGLQNNMTANMFGPNG
jgi:hypothetical protein